MTTEVRDNPAEQRFEIHADGELAGFVVYRRRPGLLALVHTEIEPRFEGRGLGSILAAGALDAARAEGVGVLPFCPFVEGWIQRHRDYADLVPAEQRASFGL